MALAAIGLAVVAGIAALWPRILAWPVAVLAGWSAVALLWRARRLHRGTNAPPRADEPADGPR
jgi:cardiolipin synthase